MAEDRRQRADRQDIAYRKLFAMAQHALSCAGKLRAKPDSDYALAPQELDVIALDYAIAALEAYVNYLGYIFIDGWTVLQKKHFWGQYEQVRDSLAKLAIAWPEEPLAHYRTLRDKRNRLHHVHSARADEQKIISHTEAAQAVEGVAAFMQDTHSKLKEGLANYPSFEAIWLKIGEDNQLKQRKGRYEDFMKDGVDH